MFENPRRGRQGRNLTTKVPKILDLKSSSEQIFAKNCRWVPPEGFAFLSVGAVFIDIVRKVFFSLSPPSRAQLTRNAADNIVRETAYFIKCS